ncbi:MAG: hemerythrin domain-containing protein [Myxococcota bacterium]
MDIITMLKEDHVKVKVMLAQLEETTESAAATRLELLGQVERELRAHMEIEETSLYPAVKASASQAGVEFDHDPLAERAAARDILARLKALSACDDMWRESFSAFKEHIEHHVRRRKASSSSWRDAASRRISSRPWRTSTPR